MSLCHSRDQQVYFSRNNPAQETNWGVHIGNIWGRKALEQEAAAASSTCKVGKCAVWAEQSKSGEGSSPHSRDGEEKRSRWMTDSARGSAWGDCEKEQSATTQAARCDLGTQCTLETGCPCESRSAACGIYRGISDGLYPTACSPCSWLPPCLTGGCIAHKQLHKHK